MRTPAVIVPADTRAAPTASTAAAATSDRNSTNGKYVAMYRWARSRTSR
jgi:hypothetical protein